MNFQDVCRLLQTEEGYTVVGVPGLHDVVVTANTIQINQAFFDHPDVWSTVNHLITSTNRYYHALPLFRTMVYQFWENQIRKMEQKCFDEHSAAVFERLVTKQIPECIEIHLKNLEVSNVQHLWKVSFSWQKTQIVLYASRNNDRFDFDISKEDQKLFEDYWQKKLTDAGQQIKVCKIRNYARNHAGIYNVNNNGLEIELYPLLSMGTDRVLLNIPRIRLGKNLIQVSVHTINSNPEKEFYVRTWGAKWDKVWKLSGSKQVVPLLTPSEKEELLQDFRDFLQGKQNHFEGMFEVYTEKSFYVVNNPGCCNKAVIWDAGTDMYVVACCERILGYDGSLKDFTTFFRSSFWTESVMQEAAEVLKRAQLAETLSC